MIALKEIDGKRKVFVSEQLILEKCENIKSNYLKKARCTSEVSWKCIFENGVRFYDFSTIPNRAPHFVVERLGNEEELIRIARFGDPAKVWDRAKEKLLAAFEQEKDVVDLAWYQYDCEELQEIKTNDKRNIRDLVEMYFEAYTWLKLIKKFFNNGWIQLGINSKREMMKLIVELLAERQIKGLKITNSDALQRKMNWFNECKGDKRNFVVHKNIQNKNRQIVTDEMVALLKSIFSGLEGGKLTYEDAWLRYNQFVNGERTYINVDTGEVYQPTDYQRLSKSTIKLYLYKYENKLGAMANRSGDWNKLSQEYIPSHEFVMPEFSNSLLSIDDFQPPFIMRGNNRVWFYAGIDLASECWIGWVHGREKNLAFVKEFYRTMVLNFHRWGVGMPMEIEMESNLNASLKDNLLIPGVYTEKATIYQNKPNAKKVERYIGVLRNEYARLHPNFVARPFAKAEWLAKGSTDPKEMEYEEIVKLYISYLEIENNKPHSKYPEMTRLEYFIKKQHANCRPIQWSKILPHLGYHTTSSVKAGKVRLLNQNCLIGNTEGIVTGEELKKYASLLNDNKISIYYLQDENLNLIAAGIYTDDDRYICSLYPTPKYQKAHCERTADDKANEELVTRYQQTFVGNMKEQKTSIQPIEEIIARENYISEEDIELLPEIVEEAIDFEPTKKGNSTWDRF